MINKVLSTTSKKITSNGNELDSVMLYYNVTVPEDNSLFIVKLQTAVDFVPVITNLTNVTFEIVHDQTKPYDEHVSIIETEIEKYLISEGYNLS